MNTFISIMFLTLAAFASARSDESYEQHVVSSGKGDTNEMPLLEIDEFAAAYAGDGGKEGEKKSDKKSDKKKKKSDKKKKKSDKSSDKKSDKKKKKSDKKKKSSSSSSSSTSSSSSSSRDRRRSRRNSSSSSSSSKSSKSSSSGDRRRFFERKNALVKEDMCCGRKSDSEQDFCEDLWEDVCRGGQNPNREAKDFCDYVGLYDDNCRVARTSLRGNMVTE